MISGKHREQFVHARYDMKFDAAYKSPMNLHDDNDGDNDDDNDDNEIDK